MWLNNIKEHNNYEVKGNKHTLFYPIFKNHKNLKSVVCLCSAFLNQYFTEIFFIAGSLLENPLPDLQIEAEISVRLH